MRVEEDSNHTTSQIIVDTSVNTVYNNTLRVRGRESGTYVCALINNIGEFFSSSSETKRRAVTGMIIILVGTNKYCSHSLATPKPLYLNATYKSPTSISLEWSFPVTPIYPYSYVAYYQSGGEGYSVAFTIDSLERDNRHELTGLPVGGVHSISLVALVDLPSPVAGPVTPGEYIANYNALLRAHIHYSMCFSC